MQRIKAIVWGLGAGSSLISMAAAAQTSPAPAEASAEPPVSADPQVSAEPQVDEADPIIITGSRIPTIMSEGPSPVTVIDADMIQSNGYTSVPEILSAVTQNSGETQSPQSGSSADFTPGAQQVDLRGLGPNHTLVLINGRRIADFHALNRAQQFHRHFEIPVSLIERVEVLRGAASAIYGSDASRASSIQDEGTPQRHYLDYRRGETEAGGGASHASRTGGFPPAASTPRRNRISRPATLWAFDRQSRIARRTPPNPLAERTFLRTASRTTPISIRGRGLRGGRHLNGGSTSTPPAALRRLRSGHDDYGPGYFCGSRRSIGYGRLSRAQGFNSFGTMSYELSDNAKLFADFQLGISKVNLMYDVTSWAFESSSSSSDNSFYNAFDGTIDDWSRQFTPEETGGLEMQRNKQTTFSVTPGVRGTFQDHWDYELSFNYSQYKSLSGGRKSSRARPPRSIWSQLGVDPDSGYRSSTPIPPALHPLTEAE